MCFTLMCVMGVTAVQSLFAQKVYDLQILGPGQNTKGELRC